MDGTNALGEFLRARRALVRPEDAGIRLGGGLRRVPGLRREEVAMLAGISADYYLRLEQGRDRNPSLQVLEALADVLNLDADATAHLIGLAQTRPSRSQRALRPADRARAARTPEPVPPGILQLMEGWTTNPAYVENKFTDVLAANALATAVSPNYSAGVNLLRAVLLDDSERELLRDWEELAEALIASLRANIGPDVDDPRLTELVGELSVRSEHFRRLWGRHDVHPKRPRVNRLHHPQVGDLELHASKLAIVGTDGLVLKVFHAEPGSRSAELLAILGSLAASGKSRNPTGPDRHRANDEQ